MSPQPSFISASWQPWVHTFTAICFKVKVLLLKLRVALACGYKHERLEGSPVSLVVLWCLQPPQTWVADQKYSTRHEFPISPTIEKAANSIIRWLIATVTAMPVWLHLVWHVGYVVWRGHIWVSGLFSSQILRSMYQHYKSHPSS